MAIRNISDIQSILGEKYKSYTGEYFSSRLDITLGEELTKSELTQIKENSISRAISVQRSLNDIYSYLGSLNWDCGIDDSKDQLVFYPKGHPELGVEYGFALETGAGIISKNGHQEANSLVYYRSKRTGEEGWCTLQEAEFDTLAELISKPGGKIQAMIREANKEIRSTGSLPQSKRDDIRKYFYPASSINNVDTLVATKAEMDEAKKELSKELGIDITKINENLLKTQRLNFGVRIRQIQEEYSNQIAKYNNKENSIYYKRQIESNLKSIYFLAATNPKEADKIIKGIEGNSQYDYITKSPAWAGMKTDLLKMAKITPVTFSNIAETALSKGNISIGHGSSLTPGQEFAQRGSRGAKAGNMGLKNIGRKKSSAKIDVGNVSAQTYEYAKNTGVELQSLGQGVGLRHAKTNDHTSGQDLRKIMRESFIKGESKIPTAIWNQAAQKAHRMKDMKKALDKNGKMSEEEKGKLFDEIFPESDFSFGRDYEQVLVSEQISHTSGRKGNKNILTSLREIDKVELDTDKLKKIEQKKKELLLKMNKKDLKDDPLIERYLNPEERSKMNDQELEKIDRYITKLDEKLSQGQKDYVDQAALRSVLHLKGKGDKYHVDLEKNEEGEVIASVKEYAQLKTGEKIAAESGLHGVVITVKNAILAQALIKAGFDPKDIFNRDGSLNVHMITELKTGSRKLGENIPSIINEFTSIRSQAIRNAESEEGRNQKYNEAKTDFTEAFMKATKKLKPILNKLKIKPSDFVDKYFKGMSEDGSFIFGNFNKIYKEVIEENKNFDSLSEEEKNLLSQNFGFDFIKAFVYATGEDSQFKVTEDSIQTKSNGGVIGIERWNIQDVATYFDPTRKGGRPVNMGYKMINDFEREADAAVKAGLISKETASVAKNVLKTVYENNLDLSKEEGGRSVNLVDDIIRGSQKTADEIASEQGVIIPWSNEKIAGHAGLEQVDFNGRRGFRLEDFQNSIFGEVYKAQSEGKDAYLDYAYNYTDENGVNIKGDAIQFGNYSDAFEIVEDEDGTQYLVPKDNAEGFLALENIKAMEGLIHSKRSGLTQIAGSTTRQQKERIQEQMNESAYTALKDMWDSVNNKKSEKYKSLHNARLSHSAFSRIISGGDSGILSRGAVGIVSTERLRQMLKRAEGEDEEGYKKGLYREADRLGIKISEDDTPQSVIEKIIDAVDIDKEGFDKENAKGLLQFLTRFPLLNGQNLPITELFASSKRNLGDAIQVDSQTMDILNADVDGDTIANALANVRSEFAAGNITEEQAKAYTEVLLKQLELFRKRTKIMKSFEKKNQKLYEEDKTSSDIITLDDFASRGNSLAASAAELATRQNRDKIGVFDNIRQGFLNSIKGNERFQTSVGAQYASEFFTSLSQDAISSKKVFEKLLNRYKGDKTALGEALGIDASLDDEKFLQEITTNIGSEIEEVLKDESTFTTKEGWSRLGAVLEKWGIADTSGDVAFDKKRLKNLAAILYQYTGDEKWLDASDGKYSFKSFGNILRDFNKDLGSYGEQDLYKIVSNPYFYNKKTNERNLPGTGNASVADITINDESKQSFENLQKAANGANESIDNLTIKINNLTKGIKEGIDNYQKVSDMVDQGGTGKTNSVTGLTKILFPFKGASLAESLENEFYERIIGYKNTGSTDKLLGFDSERERDEFLKILYPTFRGKLANIGQNLINIRSNEEAFKDITSLDDFKKIYDSLSEDERKRIDEKYWSSSASGIEDIRERINAANLSLGSVDRDNASWEDILRELRTGVKSNKYKGDQLTEAENILSLMKERLGGPKELLEIMDIIESATGSKTFSSVTDQNIQNILKLTKGRKFIGAETPLASSHNIDGNPSTSYGFSDLFTIGEDGKVYLSDIKTGKTIDEILKPQYIAQVGMYATLAKQMQAEFKNKNYTYDDMLAAYGEKYRTVTKKDLTKEEFEFLKNNDLSNLTLEILGTADSGQGRSWQANMSSLNKLGIENLMAQLIAIGNIDDPKAQELIEKELRPKLENLPAEFKIANMANSSKPKESVSKDTKLTKNDLKEFYAFFNELESVKARIDELNKLKEEAKTEEQKEINRDLQAADEENKKKKEYEEEIDSLTARRAQLNRSKEKIKDIKGWTDEDEAYAKEQWKAEKMVSDIKESVFPEEKAGVNREEAAALRGLKADYREYNRYALSLKSNKNRQAMTMDEVELASLREQEEAIKESLQASEERVKLAEESYKKQGYSTDKLNEIKDKAEKSLKLALAGENVRNKGQSTFWGQLSQQLNRTFTNFMRFGLVSKVMQTVRRSIQKVVQAAKELDKAMTNLRIVSGANADQAKQMINDYAQLAKQIGATTTEVATSANEWLRQGYSVSETNKLITASMYLSKLGMLDVNTATKDLTI